MRGQKERRARVSESMDGIRRRGDTFSLVAVKLLAFRPGASDLSLAGSPASVSPRYSPDSPARIRKQRDGGAGLCRRG